MGEVISLLNNFSFEKCTHGKFEVSQSQDLDLGANPTDNGPVTFKSIGILVSQHLSLVPSSEQKQCVPLRSSLHYASRDISSAGASLL